MNPTEYWQCEECYKRYRTFAEADRCCHCDVKPTVEYECSMCSMVHEHKLRAEMCCVEYE